MADDGTYTNSDGAKYAGEYNEGLPNGQGTMTWPDGVMYVGEWKEGKMNGQGTMTFPDGGSYVGEWKEDSPNGQGTGTSSDGKKIAGEFTEDGMNGQGTSTWPDGKTYVGEHKEGLPNGQGTCAYPDGRKKTGVWKDGKYIAVNPFIIKIGKETISSITSEEKSFYFHTDIPEKKLANAIESFAKNVAPSQVVALCDSTLFGSAKDGFLITTAAFYCKEMAEDPISFDFIDISSINLSRDNKGISSINIFFEDKSSLVIKKTAIKYNYLDADKFVKFIEKIIKSKDMAVVSDSDKMVIIEDMPEAVKIAYVNTTVNLVYEDDGQIDKKELAEIQLLMTRLNLSAEERHNIREYVSAPNTPTNDFMEIMNTNCPNGSEEGLHISLLKDLIQIYRSTNDITVDIDDKGDGNILDDDVFISYIAKSYDISKDEVAVIEQSIINDELILAGKVNDKMIVKNAKDLAAKAGAVGLPIAAVYLSGSVIGLSAAGISSGLATLGLGGLLGLSSMVTGIGVAVLIGVGTYKGARWILGGSERKKTTKREFFIGEVINNNQKTISNLAEDINFFGVRLVEMTRTSEINKALVEKYGKQLTAFSNVMSTLQDRGHNLEEKFAGTAEES